MLKYQRISQVVPKLQHKKKELRSDLAVYVASFAGFPRAL